MPNFNSDLLEASMKTETPHSGSWLRKKGWALGFRVYRTSLGFGPGVLGGLCFFLCPSFFRVRVLGVELWARFGQLLPFAVARLRVSRWLLWRGLRLLNNFYLGLRV